ncbi:MAG: hypothetical protein ACHQ1G_04950 [Planctomycetota bacterium]
MDAAHEIFQKPFKVAPTFVKRDTPANYRSWPDGRDLPGQMDVWVVHGKLGGTNYGLVSDGYGFLDSPDCELISGGINSKGPGSVAIGRQANLLLWGFCASPSEMTEEARRVFLNAVVWMKQFDGARVAFEKTRPARQWALLYAANLGKKGADWAQKQFAPELLGGEDVEGALRADLEYLYNDGVFRVDADAKALGIGNRDVKLLDRCVEVLGTEDAGHGKAILARYLAVRFDTAAQWKAWLAKNREQLYFTDTGGYVWRVRE